MAAKSSGLIARFIKWLLDLILEGFRQQGRVEVEQAQREAADAARADYDEIAGDGRSFDDAAASLRARAKARDGNSRGVP